jgi:cation:H+ antiporter
LDLRKHPIASVRVRPRAREVPVAEVVVLLLGIALAFVGGDLFVRGAVGLAAALGIPSAIIGATVAAFATSSPELVVAISAATRSEAAIAVGDALGSNVVNIAVVLGVALLLRPLVVDPHELVRNLPFAVGAPVLVAVLLVDGTLTRSDALVLLVAFFAWLAWTAVEAHRSRVVEALGDGSRGRAAVHTLVGLGLLVAAGQAIVWSAQGIGKGLGLDEFVVGATLVAIGTSTPELVTTVVSRRRGHDDVGTGTVIGSNIFNTLWIVGIACLIDPVVLDVAEVRLAIVAGVVSSLLLVSRSGVLGRARGALLVTVYGAFVGLLLMTA